MTLKDIILCKDTESSFDSNGLTMAGIMAIYNNFYIDDTYIFVEYLEKISSLPNKCELYRVAMEMIVDKIFEYVSEKEVLEYIYNGEFFNYLSSREQMFLNYDKYDYHKWAKKVADILCIEL